MRFPEAKKIAERDPFHFKIVHCLFRYIFFILVQSAEKYIAQYVKIMNGLSCHNRAYNMWTTVKVVYQSFATMDNGPPNSASAFRICYIR